MNRFLIKWKFKTATVWAETLHVFAEDSEQAEQHYVEVRWNNGIPEGVELTVTEDEAA